MKSGTQSVLCYFAIFGLFDFWTFQLFDFPDSLCFLFSTFRLGCRSV